MSAYNIQLIAKAVKAAVERDGRPVQLSVTRLHEEFGAPAPMVVGTYMDSPGSILTLGQALREIGWRGPPPVYKDGIFYAPDWSKQVMVLWDEASSARRRVDEITEEYKQKIDAAEHEARDWLSSWARFAAEEALSPKA